MTEKGKPGKRWKKFRDDEKKSIVEMYEDGKSIRDIAAVFNRSYGGVHNVLTEAGVRLRQRGVDYSSRRTPSERLIG